MNKNNNYNDISFKTGISSIINVKDQNILEISSRNSDDEENLGLIKVIS